MTDLSPDRESLRQYVQLGSQEAFSRLVAAHVDMVYSSALRQVRGRRDLAEEVTQVTFIILAQKAPKLDPDTVILPAWLHRTVHFTAANVRKTEARRRAHERKAAEMTLESRRVDSSWEKLAPLLDQGVARLGEKDRSAILMRFFQKKSLAETGQALGVSEDAAAMRISRAIAKLRLFFKDRGVALPATAISGIITANATHAAPSAFTSTLATKVLHTLHSPTAASTATAHAVTQSMAISKAGTLTFYAATSLAAAAAVVLLAAHLASLPPHTPKHHEPTQQSTMDTDRPTPART